MGFFNFLFNRKNENTNALLNVTVAPNFILPKAFADKWDEIEKSAIDYIEIKAFPSNDIKQTESSFGAVPFIPMNFDYPKDENGDPMLPLAQLNFAQIPSLKDYPIKGILQFYIANTDCYGLDFDNPFNQNSFRVVYIESPENLDLEFNVDFINELLKSENTPIFKPHKLTFTKKTEYIGMSDYRSEQHSFRIEPFLEQFNEDIRNKLETVAYDTFNTNGHKVGGYAYFTQTDPREYEKKLREHILLFQIDSDDEIMWGDVGVGNFFITRENLIKKDFSKVFYNWDCC